MLTLEEAPLCMSRGPRIGDGCPYCKLPEGHGGRHYPADDDGWDETVFWSDPW